MAHTLTLLKHESGYGGYLWTKVKYRVEGDVFYLLRFFLTMPSRDTPASSRGHFVATKVIWDVRHGRLGELPARLRSRPCRSGRWHTSTPPTPRLWRSYVYIY